LVGIAAGVLGAKEVILSDLPHALPLIQKNIERSLHAVSAAAGCQQQRRASTSRCMECDWFCPPNNELLSWHADVILVADCIWIQELVAPLLTTIKQLTDDNKDATVLISYQRRGKPTHVEFWTGIHSLFGQVNEIDVSSVGLDKPESLFLLNCHR
jgi:hypothetical protein